LSLKENRYVAAVDEVIIASGPPRRHRGFPTGVRLPDGDILVGYRDGSDHHMTSDGAFYTTRSNDNGRHWTPPKVMAAYPGWNVIGHIGQYPDGVMPRDEPFLWTLLKLDHWDPDPPAGADYRAYTNYWVTSRDFGRTWDVPVPLWQGKGHAIVKTDRGDVQLLRPVPHSTTSTLLRLDDGAIMGMWNGNNVLTKYKDHVQARIAGEPPKPNEVALAGFSNDEMRTWEFVVVAAPDDHDVGFSEADVVKLASGRLVVIYGNNQGSPFFWRTWSDDNGRTWAPLEQLAFRGDSPSMITLADGTLVAAIRYLPEEGPIGIGIVASPDGGETWDVLGNARDQDGWDMGYPDLVKTGDGRILCIFYTDAESKMIPPDLEAQLYAKEPMRTILGDGTTMRQFAYEELNGEIRGIFLEDLTGRRSESGKQPRASDSAKFQL